MLGFLFRRRLRAQLVSDLLAGLGVAIGVALVFGVLLSNASLTSAAREVVHGLTGSARFELASRSRQGFSERFSEEAGELPGVQVAAPVLRENVTLLAGKHERAVQLIGVTPSLEALGGESTEELAGATQLLKGGIGLPSEVASGLSVSPGQSLQLESNGEVQSARVRTLFLGAHQPVESSPVAVALLGVAQGLARRPRRVTEVLIRPVPGAEAEVARELQALAGSRLEVYPAARELQLLEVATRPNRQSTSLFSAIAVMIGFLLALNAMLLTVPERRRFVAELRMHGYDARQIVLLLGGQAAVLGAFASLVGVGLGDLLSHAFFQSAPDFLSAAFPVGAHEAVHLGAILVALGCGMLATALASLAPLLDLRAGRPVDGVLREAQGRGETVKTGTLRTLSLVGVVLLAGAIVLAVLAPSLSVLGGVGLALATVCLIPPVFAAVTSWLPKLLEGVRSSALIVALAELRAMTTRSIALAGIVGIAVYGAVAIGGARNDLLSGIGDATDQYFSSAAVWVSAGRDVFNTNGFSPAGPMAAAARAPGVASVRSYQGGLLDVGERRMWVRAKSSQAQGLLEASQLLQGNYSSATRLIGGGGWVALSGAYAEESHLGVGDVFVLPTPSGPKRLRVAAVTTNSGWPPGAITMNTSDYRRFWQTSEASALEVTLKPGVSPAQGKLALAAALARYPGLSVQTASERALQSRASAREGLRTLSEISTLLLLAAALAVAAALSANVWRRRARMASLKIQGYDAGQLWRAVLIESAVTIGVGAAVGAVIGVGGHVLASRFLRLTTGFPAPFSVGPTQVLLTLALLAAVALAVIALPGMAAARVSPRVVLQR